MIVDAIERWMRGEYVSTTEQLERAERFIEGVAEQSWRRVFVDRDKHDAERPPISGSARWQCAKHMQHAIERAEKGDKAPRAYNAFWLGDMVEAMVIAQAIAAGVPVAYPAEDGTQYETSLTLDGDVIRGHVDAVVDDPRYGPTPIEFKSMNEYRWTKSAREGVENTFGYVDQLGFYILGMEAKQGLFVGVNKSTGHVFEEWRKAGEFRRDYYEKQYALAKSGKAAKPKWATDRFVRGMGGRPSTLEVQDVRCSYCDFRAHCWPGYEQVMVSGKVQWRKPLSDEEASALKNGTK